MSKYMIALKSGKVLNDLRLNGNMYVSKTEVTAEDLTPEELAEVTITETDSDGNATVTRMTDAVCDTVKHWPEGWIFNIREKTTEENRRRKLPR